MRSFIVLLATGSLVAGCTKTNEAELLLEAKQQELCTKDTISFQQHVMPVIQANCMPCHNSAQASGSIVLETYDQVSAIASGPAPSLLIGVVKHEPGYLAMPKDRPKLKDCEIRALEVWANQGALNN